MDTDAQKDFTHRMTRTLEKKNWWISLNTSGRNEPMKLRSDFCEASTKLHRLHRESGEERLAPIPSGSIKNGIRPSSSSSTSWWQGNDSWWSSEKNKKSQAPLSSWTEQRPRTGRLVEDTCSSSYSEWNADETWSSQEWKSDELMVDRSGRPIRTAHGQIHC